MNVEIIITDEFSRSAKKLLKKYKSLRNELIDLNRQLLDNPYLGDRIQENVYKIRLAIKSKGKGKSGGARIITYLDIEVKNDTENISILLLRIYDKSEISSLSNAYIKQIVERNIYRTEEE